MNTIKKYGFTLLETMVVMTIFLILVTVITSLFINLYKIKGGLEGRQRVSQDSYFLLEKLQTMVKDYTIDYEEYWNRQAVGCYTTFNHNGDPYPSPQWSTTGNCSYPTYYGNVNVIDGIDFYNPLPGLAEWEKHVLYYCTSIEDAESTNYESGVPYIFGFYDLTDLTKGCKNRFAYLTFGPSLGPQSYGQYAKLFLDVKDDVDYVPGAANDDDDVDLGNGPEAIYQSGDNMPQELYLISHDRQRRLLIRRVLKNKEAVEDGTADINNDGVISNSEKLYSLQVLQLRGFDAGEAHNFDAETYRGVYDGIIDTRACDYSLGFECKGLNIGGAYSGYRLAEDENDGWVDLMGSDVTISDWNLSIYPLKDPKLAWKDPISQQSPYVRISLVAQLYAKNWKRKLSVSQMDAYTLPLQTQFSFLVE